VREIDKTLSNPVWAQVRRPAPWEVADTVDAMFGKATAAAPSTALAS
jgi:nitrogenase molybdenum-cofactor synthesis protein NifE